MGLLILRSAVSDAFTTTFPATENPISQSGIWVNGDDTGLDWQNVQTTPSKVFAAAFLAASYDDAIAHLSSAYRNFAPNQYAEATVHRAVGYSPAVNHEIELLLRFNITANSAQGYEVLWTHQGFGAIVRWNGPVGNFTALLDNQNIGQAADGDVLRAEITGSVVTVYKNGALVMTAPSDSTYADGQPGVGFWPQPGSTLASYGWKDFQAGDL